MKRIVMTGVMTGAMYAICYVIAVIVTYFVVFVLGATLGFFGNTGALAGVCNWISRHNGMIELMQYAVAGVIVIIWRSRNA